ncbi:MAG TPA: hypothetical protein VGA43_04595, partial [Deferrimonas sp.]
MRRKKGEGRREKEEGRRETRNWSPQFCILLQQRGIRMNKNIKLPETEEGTILFNTDPIIVKH